MENIRFDWDENTGQSVCTIFDKGKIYQGFAWCREEDKDMQSRLTGQTIAEYRAHIAQLKGMRDNEIKPGLAALKQAKYSMNQSKYFNEASYEYRMLEQQIKNLEEDLIFTKNMITLHKARLKQYMNDKADFYERIRKNRQKAKNE